MIHQTGIHKTNKLWHIVLVFLEKYFIAYCLAVLPGEVFKPMGEASFIQLFHPNASSWSKSACGTSGNSDLYCSTLVNFFKIELTNLFESYS